MINIQICKDFGWDYYTLMAQPVWFIDLIKDKMEIDAKKAKQHKK